MPVSGSEEIPLKGTDPKEHCPDCGYRWKAHEFAVPAPYCPSNEKDAEQMVKSFKTLPEIMAAYDRVKSRKVGR